MLTPRGSVCNKTLWWTEREMFRGLVWESLKKFQMTLMARGAAVRRYGKHVRLITFSIAFDVIKCWKRNPWKRRKTGNVTMDLWTTNMDKKNRKKVIIIIQLSLMWCSKIIASLPFFHGYHTILTPEINNQSLSIFTHPSSQPQSKFVFECANNLFALRVVTYMVADRRLIWIDIDIGLTSIKGLRLFWA
jgi:hypothetical protein